MNRHQQEIKNYIDKARLDDELKKLFTVVFDALQQEQQETLVNLALRFQGELNNYKNNWDDIWNIKVHLAENGDEVVKLEQQGFQIIDVGNSMFINTMPVSENVREFDKIRKGFLLFDGSYDDFLGLLQKEAVYSGSVLLDNDQEVEFRYRVKANHRIIRMEEMLFKIAKLYGIQRPVIFSPFARRAVDIEVLPDRDFDSLGKVMHTDLKLKDNGLAMIKEGHCLLWNISITEGVSPDSVDDNDERVALDVTQKRYKYIYRSNIDKNDFVYPMDDLDYPEILKGENDICFICKNRMHQSNFKKVSVHNEASKNSVYMKEFCNTFLRGSQDIIRIRTAGDVQYVLSQFTLHDGTDKVFWCDYDAKHDCADSRLVITRYAPEHDYWNDREQIHLQRIKNRPFCYIKFFCQENRRKFLTDYANYVLHYLNCMYPEFCWAGVQA